MQHKWDKSKAPQAQQCKPVEWLLGFASISYGWILLLPDDTYGTTPSFKVLLDAGWLPEPVLGTIMVSVGLLQIAAVWRLGHRIRMGVAVVVGVQWTLLYAMLSSYTREQHIHTPTTVMYALPVWGAMYCLVYIGNTVRRRLDNRKDALKGKKV